MEIRKKNYARFFFLILAAFFLLIFLTLGKSYLYDWDEAIYAQVGREMILAKTIFGLWNGNAWLEKPPLVPFVSALSYTFGHIIYRNIEFWFRLPSFLAFILYLYFIYKIIKFKLPKKSDIYFASTILIILSSKLFFIRNLSLNTDIFLLVGWLGFYYYYQKGSVLQLPYLMIGVLSKSFLGFYPVLVVLAEDIILKKLSLKKIGQLLFFSFLSSIWFLAAFLKFGHVFIKEHLLEHLFYRVIKPVELHYGGYFHYVKLIFRESPVLAILSLFALFYIGYLILFKKKYNLLFIPLFLGIFVFISLSKTKLDWYIFPVIPVLALALSVLFVDLSALLKIDERLLWFIAIVVMILIIYARGNILFKFHKEKPPEKVKLAEYIKNKCAKIDYLVDAEERKFYHVISAANVGISSTFRYGGSPAFRFYVEKKVNFYYDIAEFKSNALQSGKCLVISKKDKELFPVDNYNLIYQSDNFLVYNRR